MSLIVTDLKKLDLNHISYELHEALWVAVLEDGTKAYSNNYGANDRGWLNLKQYTQDNKVKIKSLYLKYWDNEVKPLPENADGYFFCLGSFLFLVSDGNRFENGIQKQMYVIGSYNKENNELTKHAYIVPDLIPLYVEPELKLNHERIIHNVQ